MLLGGDQCCVCCKPCDSLVLPLVKLAAVKCLIITRVHALVVNEKTDIRTTTLVGCFEPTFESENLSIVVPALTVLRKKRRNKSYPP